MLDQKVQPTGVLPLFRLIDRECLSWLQPGMIPFVSCSMVLNQVSPSGDSFPIPFILCLLIVFIRIICYICGLGILKGTDWL
jgi:hypothetical protein